MSVKMALLAMAFAYFVILVPRIEGADSAVVPRTAQEQPAEE